MTDYRIRLISRLIPILALLVLVRLYYWQIIRGRELSIAADRQYQDTVHLSAQRGEVVDSNGSILAGTNNLYHLYAYKPTMKANHSDVAAALAAIIAPDPPATMSSTQTDKELLVEKTRVTLLDRLNLKSNWVTLKHYLSSEQKSLIESLNLVGLGFEDEYVRFYPEASMSAQILGFVGKDQIGEEKGYFGIEGFFDRELHGRAGVIKMEKDATGKQILLGKYEKLETLAGRSIGTTIDRRIQYLAESLLESGIEKYQATSGGVIIMETKTGKVRAMASLPSYDPAKFSDYDQKLYQNPNVASLFEPGSTFKVLIMASALSDKLITPDTLCDICSGPITIGKYQIKTWNEEYHPNSTMTDVIKNSDNTGMVYIGRKLGANRLHYYLQQFGFGQKTGIEIEEEASGWLNPESDFGEVDIATTTFGQGIAVTPIQLISAVNAIANGGYFLEPVLVDRLITPEKTVWLKKSPPRQVISPEAAKDTTAMMVNAVANGEAKYAKPKGISIAGKTGTAQIPIEGHYDKEKTIASFIGFFPASDPKYTMLVTLREPQTSQWGSETAAPLWFSIAKQLSIL